MATYTRVVFSQDIFRDEVLRICDIALDDAVMLIMQNEWFKGSAPSKLQNFDGGYEIPANDLKAWLVEYGTGVHMRDDNPHLAEYKKSVYYNKLRPASGEIVTWGDVDYLQKAYEFGMGTTVKHGAAPAGKVVSKGTEAKPFVKDLLRSALLEFNASFRRNMANFNYSKCFIATQVNV